MSAYPTSALDILRQPLNPSDSNAGPVHSRPAGSSGKDWRIGLMVGAARYRNILAMLRALKQLSKVSRVRDNVRLIPASALDILAAIKDDTTSNQVISVHTPFSRPPFNIPLEDSLLRYIG